MMKCNICGSEGNCCGKVYQEKLEALCVEIELEIARRPNSLNVGKKGCLTRLYKILEDY